MDDMNAHPPIFWPILAHARFYVDASRLDSHGRHF